ncbi:conserved hypothetical protein [Scheffersomyces stipitis CBS 6054]|uniref:Uncharacterized protein n=1 Tax=Scheffersomyces stipitis (strain ATCC 58785 / CBS 6054 / NBRC 10063 / NRRL Y-11545) TaxID=322104 RepID=A3LYB3_PICST|nr:conserved hypothetical protein [Scheffersomyces stipitis CBS 6054]ABN67952.1 conserved hypothetical protein [Scheffersomyces stipitis CBS 6054]
MFDPSDQGTPYTAIKGVMHLIYAIQNSPDPGTGIIPLVEYAKNLLGPKIPDSIIYWNLGNQNGLFGGYPSRWDIAPSIAFAVIFFILAVMHLVIFGINFSRGHYFWITFIWGLNACMKVMGFSMRAYWSYDITRVKLGLASEVFCIIPFVIMVSFNLILAQRLFTWRHPVGGSRWLFWNFMFALYGFVCILLVVTIIASFFPYLYFLSYRAYFQYQQVVMATCILIIAYSLTSIALIALSYWAPTKKDENLYTYQPWWIESFHPFYFVQPFAAQKAEETFMKRNHNHRHAVRVIASTHHHYNVVEGLNNQRGDLKHNKSILILCASTLLIFVGTILRTIVVFQAKPIRLDKTVTKPVVMYIVWGLFEVFVNLLYLVGRVDLRFYRPDNLPPKVRAIITAEQTYYPSEDEDEDERASFDEDYEAGPQSLSSDGYKFNNNVSGSKPPYPYEEKKEKDDNESEFNF